MRNRAKCKACNHILESFAHDDFVSCECGNLTIWGGGYKFNVLAKDYNLMLRVDDEDCEHPVKYVEVNKADTEQEEAKERPKPLTQEELIEEFKKLIEAFEKDADHVCTYADLASITILLVSCLKSAMATRCADLS